MVVVRCCGVAVLRCCGVCNVAMGGHIIFLGGEALVCEVVLRGGCDLAVVVEFNVGVVGL